MVEATMHHFYLGTRSNGYHRYYCYCSKGMNSRSHCECFNCNSRCYLEFRENKSSTKFKGLYGLCMSEGRYTSFGVARPRTRRGTTMSKPIVICGSLMVSCKIAGVQYDSSREKQTMLIPEKKELVYENSIQLKVPPPGSLKPEQDFILQNVGVNYPDMVSKGAKDMIEDRLFYLEERNEEALSRRILKLSRLNKVKSVLKLYKSMECLGLQPNLHACNSVLSCLLRNGMTDDALRIFDVMKAREMTTGHSYSLIFKAVSDTWGCDAALSMFEELERNNSINKFFDVVVYNTMISIFSKVDNWVQTENIWRRLQRKGYPGTTVTYRLLVCTFVRCSQNELALDAYHEMVQNRVMPGDDAMQAIIGACMKEGKWDLALTVFQSMLDCGMKPNLIACNALINSLAKSGKVKLAFKVFDLMKSLGHAPDAYTWNALLGALNKANQHANALQLFDSIRRGQSSVLNRHIYNSVLMSCQRLGLWDRALKLLWQMEASGLSLSTTTYNLVIGACEAARQPKVALQIYDHMLHQEHPPDIFTLLSLIRSCIWGSLWSEVQELLHRYPANGSMYNTAIQGLCLRGKIDLAMQLYVKMKALDLKPDGKTRALVLQNLPKYKRKGK